MRLRWCSVVFRQRNSTKEFDGEGLDGDAFGGGSARTGGGKEKEEEDGTTNGATANEPDDPGGVFVNKGRVGTCRPAPGVPVYDACCRVPLIGINEPPAVGGQPFANH